MIKIVALCWCIHGNRLMPMLYIFWNCQNRQSYTQLHGDAKASTVRSAGKARGQQAKVGSKDTVAEAATFEESKPNSHDAHKSLCICFVRLNGILFTRTSLETFAEVLSLVVTSLSDLLPSGPVEEMNFGKDASENGVFFVRLVSILIFTIQNAKRESEGQSYAEIVQRAVLLQNAFIAVFEIMGHVMERCEQVHDPSLSYLLPGILVFVEWLASYPDVATGGDVDEKQATARSNFWSHYVSLLNKLLSMGSMSIDDCGDESCFGNMSKYEEGETANRLALWEDFELRGFLPLAPAQTILDFTRKHSFGSEGQKEKSTRVKRTLAAGKVLISMVEINNKTVWYDSKTKKFVTSVESQMSVEELIPPDSTVPQANDLVLKNGGHIAGKFEESLSNSQLYVEGEDEDEEIVFQPTLVEKQTETSVQNLVSLGTLEPQKNDYGADQPFSVAYTSVPLDKFPHVTMADAFSWNPVLAGNIQPIKSHTSSWLMEENLSNSFTDLRMMENGYLAQPEIKENTLNFCPAVHTVSSRQPAGNSNGWFLNQANAPEAVVPSSRYNAINSSGVSADALTAKPSSAFSVGLKKNPVARPVRHLGPPPGFSAVPKQTHGPTSGLDLIGQNQMTDDYSWLDGYQMSSAIKGVVNNSISYPSHVNPPQISGSAASIGTVGFPFPGKQVQMAHQLENQKGWQDFETLEHLNLQHEKQMQQPQHIINGNPQLGPLPEQYQGSVWMGRHLV